MKSISFFTRVVDRDVAGAYIGLHALLDHRDDVVELLGGKVVELKAKLVGDLTHQLEGESLVVARVVHVLERRGGEVARDGELAVLDKAIAFRVRGRTGAAARLGAKVFLVELIVAAVGANLLKGSVDSGGELGVVLGNRDAKLLAGGNFLDDFHICERTVDHPLLDGKVAHNRLALAAHHGGEGSGPVIEVDGGCAGQIFLRPFLGGGARLDGDFYASGIERIGIGVA